MFVREIDTVSNGKVDKIITYTDSRESSPVFYVEIIVAADGIRLLNIKFKRTLPSEAVLPILAALSAHGGSVDVKYLLSAEFFHVPNKIKSDAIDIICAHAAIDQQNKRSMLADLDLLIPEIDVHREVIALLDTDFQVAKQRAVNAQIEGYNDVLWVLGNKLQSTNRMTQAIEIYQLVTSKSQYFQTANYELFHLLLKSDTDSLDSEDQEGTCVLRFRAAINAGPENQALIDQLYHALCGYTDGKPIAKNVKGDPDTLINLAHRIRSLEETLKSAKKSSEESSCKQLSLSHTVKFF